MHVPVRLGTLASAGLLACGLALAADSPSALLTGIRQRMADNLKRLPNYTCTETIERRIGPAGSRHLPLADRIRLEVAYVGDRELFSWPGEKTFEDKDIGQIVGRGGAISNGSFALHARTVFQTGTPLFSWAGEEQRDGRKIVRFEFQISREKSRWAVQSGFQTVVVAYRGVIEADAETLAAVRLEVHLDEPPPDLDLRRVTETIQYHSVRIGDSDFLLPLSSELTMVQTSGVENQNLTQFEKCRQYAGVSTLHFDDTESNAGGSTKPAEPIRLPAGLRLETRLETAINRADAARGDLVVATVTSDVKKAGAVIVPKGAVLTGRITRIGSINVRSAVYVALGLRFHSIEVGSRSGALVCELEDAGMGGRNTLVGNKGSDGESFLYVRTQTSRIPSGTRLVLRTR